MWATLSLPPMRSQTTECIRGCFAARGGRAQRRAVTGGRPPHSRLSYESTFSRDSRLRGAPTTDRNCSRSPGSHHLRPPLPTSALLLSIHLFVRTPSSPLLPFLPANWCCTAPLISPPCLQNFSLGQLLSAASPGCCWKTSRTFKKKK